MPSLQSNDLKAQGKGFCQFQFPSRFFSHLFFYKKDSVLPNVSARLLNKVCFVRICPLTSCWVVKVSLFADVIVRAYVPKLRQNMTFSQIHLIKIISIQTKHFSVHIPYIQGYAFKYSNIEKKTRHFWHDFGNCPFPTYFLEEIFVFTYLNIVQDAASLSSESSGSSLGSQ